MPQVPAVATRWDTRKNFAIDVVSALQRLGLTQPSAQVLAAHMALSTGWGKSSTGGPFNYSMTGIKATSESQPYFVKPGSEVVNGVETPKTPMKWVSFDSLDAGLAGTLSLLKATRYAGAYALLLNADPEYFAEVGREGWYTANPAQMKSEMSSNLATIKSWTANVTGSTKPTGEGGGGGGSAATGTVLSALLPLAALGLGLWWYYKR